MPTLMEAHLSDGALVRLLDGETDAPERASDEAHLAQCAECGARYADVERRSARLAELLRETDYAPPAVPAIAPAAATDELAARRARRSADAPARRPWLTAAAAAVLLLGIGFAASPARAWVAEWIGERWAEVARFWAPDEPPVSSEAAPAEAATRIAFSVRGSDFTLSFATPQRAGAVVFTVGEDGGASIEVHSAGAAPDVLVLPEGVRIQNTLGSTAEYRVTLPAHTRRVRLQVGEGAPVWMMVDELRVWGRIGLADGAAP
jgi:hypothetical protein